MNELSFDEMREVLARWLGTGNTAGEKTRRRNIAELFEAVIIRAERAEAEARSWQLRALAAELPDEVEEKAANDVIAMATVAAHWQANAERAEAARQEWEDNALRWQAQLREVMEHNADLRAQLDEATERIIQLVEYIMNSGLHVPYPPDASASDILGPLADAPDEEERP